MGTSWVSNETGIRKKKEVATAYFKALSQHLPVGTEKKKLKFLGSPAFRAIIKLGTFLIHAIVPTVQPLRPVLPSAPPHLYPEVSDWGLQRCKG